MVHLPYLQPFADVNKHTSRLLGNLPMIRANLCPLTFIDVPEQAYSRAVIGVYEMTRIELLRDLYIWVYERSTQEYLAIKQNLSEPEPLRLMYRNIINQTVREAVIQRGQEPLKVIRRALEKQVPEMDRENVEYLVIAELRRLHEGVLVRYGLSRFEFSLWQAQQYEF